MVTTNSANPLAFSAGMASQTQQVLPSRSAPSKPSTVTLWDSYGDAEYPDGCWVCGIEGQTPTFGNSPEEAEMRWKARAADSAA